MTIGRLQTVPLRIAFPHEAHNFTGWLEKNIDVLTEPLGIILTVLEREKRVGSFNVDLFCEDKNGDYVIVENQIERSNHNHLGKLMTYMVNLEAKTAIWVVSEAYPEHEKVINWLNESTNEDYAFYLVQVQAVQIDNSPYAPLFTPVAFPTEQAREIGKTKKELAERHYLRRDFWTSLLDRCRTKTNLFSGRSPTTDHWLDTGAGKSGIKYSFTINKNRFGVELYLDTGDQEKNKYIFDNLYTDKDIIEGEFGTPILWQRLDDKKASRIAKYFIDRGGLYAQDNWDEIQDKMIEAMIRLEKVFRPRLAKL